MMTDRLRNRYLILALGACVQFCYGIAYVWSMFQPYAIKKYNLDISAANLPFGVMLALFAVGNLTGGFLQRRCRATLLIYIGSTVMCSGLLATAYVPVDKAWLLNVTFGVIVGLGCGIAYNTLLATMQKWFPDKRGMVTGIVVCSAGLFGLIMNPIAQHFLETGGFTIAMTVVAGSLYLICLACGWVIQSPPEGYMTDYRPTKIPMTGKQYQIREMLKTKQYYLIAFSFMFAVPAYFLINPMLMSLGVERGLTTGTALFGVMLVSVMNTSGRLSAPWLSDRIGRKLLLLSLFLLSMLSVLALTVAYGNLFLILIACIALAYGGFMGMYPTISSDYFGIKNAGVNYGVVMLGYAACSVICPYIVRAVKVMPMGTAFSFVIAAVANVLGFILILRLKKPE